MKKNTPNDAIKLHFRGERLLKLYKIVHRFVKMEIASSVNERVFLQIITNETDVNRS